MTTDHIQASVVDAETFSVTRTVTIAAPVSKVWTAITDPEHISQWFGRADFEGTSVGSFGTLTFDGHGTVPIRIESIDEPRSIAYRWGNDDALGRFDETVPEKTSTVFTFTLREIEGGTELTVVENGFERTSAPLSNMQDHRQGWDAEIDKLVALLGGRA